MRFLQISFIFCLLLSFPSYAEVYKWVDKDGNVHYGDKPVNNSTEMNVQLSDDSTDGPSNSNRSERRQKILDALREDREEKEKQRAEEKKKKKKLKRQCQWAKDQLQGYENASGIYDLDKDGKRVMMSDKQRNKFTNKLRSDIKKHCK